MNSLFFFIFLLVCVAAAGFAKKLSWPAAFTGGLLGLCIFWGVGWGGIALLGSFFLLGTLATTHQSIAKNGLRTAQENDGRRNAGQVLANGGLAGLLGTVAIIYPQQKALMLLLMAGAFSSAAADTVSSELGSVYGKRFYDILTWKNGLRGNDGVVSAEGSLFGLAGSLVVACVYAVAAQWGRDCFWIVVAGTVGNLADSYLGATMERKGFIRNDTVNVLNTLAAVLFLLLLRLF